jgi:DNA-binding Xre family transcriptional regulator
MARKRILNKERDRRMLALATQLQNVSQSLAVFLTKLCIHLNVTPEEIAKIELEKPNQSESPSNDA